MSRPDRGLARQVANCMLAHRPRLARRLRELRRAPPRDLPRLEAQLRLDIEASAAHAVRRRELAPGPVYPDLPVVHEKDRIAAALASHQVIIVSAETGSGKSTQLPKVCLELGRGVTGLIGHTQPRRIAARSIAARIAEELNSPLGVAVGYKVRFSGHVGNDTYIKLMTDGILLAEIQHDRWLRQYDTLIIDEAHERTLNIDFLLGYLQRILLKRPDLKVIIASATIESQRFSRHFGDMPIVEVSGRGYPVEVRHRPLAGENDDARERNQQNAILDAVCELIRAGPGDILVFLPGEREIRETLALLSKSCKGLEILPLYARLSAAEQQRVFKPDSGRRVVLATNVAETSLTVPGVRYVIDTGTARISRYSVRSKVQHLGIEPISQASARQRMGRCGRTAPGICIRLYSQEDFDTRPAFTDPELKRTNLAAVILKMEHLKLGTVDSFPFLDPPERRFINDGYKLLKTLGALDGERGLTTVGQQLARLPVDPRLGRMILAAANEHCLHEVLIIVAALAAVDPRERPLDKQQRADEKHRAFQHPQSDFMSFVKLWTFIETQRGSATQLRKLCRQNFLSYVRLREWQDVHRQLTATTRELRLKDAPRPVAQPVSYDAVHRALVVGLIDQIGYREEDGVFAGPRNVRFRVFPGSGLYQKPPRWLVAAELAETSRLYARTVAKIEPAWIERAAAHLVRREYFDPHWQPTKARVDAYERVTLWGIVLAPRRRVDYGHIDPVAAREIFIREALVAGRYRTRAAFARHNRSLIEDIEGIENRARRRDILIDPEDLCRFYAERIPTDIHSGAAFARWVRRAEHDQSLFLTRAQLMRHGAEEITADRFPSHMRIAGTELPLSYRFEPGHPADGVTVTVPLPMLNQLDPRACEWLVPGFLEDKIAALIKGLPKPLRRKFVPAPDFARAAALALSSAQGALTDALATELKRMTGVEVPRYAWNLGELPPYLRLRFEITDGQDVVADGRDLSSIAARLKGQAASEFQSLATSGFERDQLTDWSFGSLPSSIDIERGGVRLKGYPALIDTGESVSLRALDTPERACVRSRHGTRRLYMLRLKDQVKYLRKNLPDIHTVCLLYQGIGDCESLKVELIEAAFDQVLLSGKPLPLDRAGFESRLEIGCARLIESANELCAQIKMILGLHHRLRGRLAQNVPPKFGAARGDIKSQLEHLVYAGFIARTQAEWLVHVPRYLQAVDSRLDRLARDPVKDSQLQREVEPFWARWLAHMREGGEHEQTDPALARYRWMIEEYRVSLFAQQLGTAVKISAKRLEAQWAAIQLGAEPAVRD
jgi:ATP-dependent helicase HrpA